MLLSLSPHALVACNNCYRCGSGSFDYHHHFAGYYSDHFFVDIAVTLSVAVLPAVENYWLDFDTDFLVAVKTDSVPNYYSCYHY